ncbi:hypothetical protein JCM30566_17080 [Marinitoga arctica]
MNIDFNDFDFLYIKLDKNGIIKDINNFGSNLIGLPKEKIINVNVFDNFIPKSELKSRLLNFKTFFNDTNNTFKKRSTLKFISANNEEVFLDLFSSIYYDEIENEKVFVCFGYDITEKIKYGNLNKKIQEIHKLIIKSFSISNDELYNFFLTKAIEIIDGADAGSILMKENDGLFHFVAAKNFDLEKIKNVKLTKELLFPQKKVLIRKKIESKYRTNEDVENMKQYGKIDKIKSTLVIPIIIDNKIKGSINLDSFKSENAFDKNDIQLGEIISSELSQVIKRNLLEKKLKFMALHDQLTTLPNRAFFMEYGERMINYAKRRNQRLAIAYFDLKKFKSINDNYGHDAGDHFLFEFAEALKMTIRNSDFPARMGGDEFVVLFHDIDKKEIINIINRINEKLKTPFKYKNVIFHIEFNSGVSFFPEDSENLDELINLADKAMYIAKNNNILLEFYKGENDVENK